MNESNLLSMSGVSKSFASNRVLDNVEFSIDAGEIVALLGTNGAGKSTLMKIMTGIYSSDTGETRLNGRPISIESPRDTMAYGIRLIPQELSVLPAMTVAENIHLGAMPSSGTGPMARIRFKDMAASAAELLASLGLDKINPATVLSRLSFSEQRLVEIARALAGKARVLVMDEPTASLSEPERDRLFAIMRRLKQSGAAIVFISHYLDEVFSISDRIIVLRDGMNAGNFTTSNTGHVEVLAAMLGREFEDLFPERAAAPGEAAFEADSLRGGRSMTVVSVSARKGEIHAVFGLIGSGIEEIGKALFGALPLESGILRLDGGEFDPSSPSEAIAAGVGFVPGERKAEGIIADLSVRENFTLPFLGRYSGRFSVARARQTEFANRWIRDLAVKTTGPEQVVRSLSGGNQQKVCIGRWLVDDLSVLILEEPTRGVDLGARRDIYSHLRHLSDGGLTVIMISSDAEEVAGLADSITVLRNGRSVARFEEPQAPERLMRAAGSALAA
ncbi:MAG: sugar ABC transporter ATP-binding protein [Albidovulum sp.]|nr:sugar ABC transporter ATP-binding protein [Albidovulum sp.]